MDVVLIYEGEITPMSDLLSLELDKNQREVLLRGLRFVRSAIMLTPEDPTDELVASRRQELDHIAALSSLLDGRTVTQESSV